MDEVRLFIGFYADAIRALLDNPRALVFAFFGTLFGMTIPGFLQSGGPLESFAPIVSAFVERHSLILLATPIPFVLFVLSSAGLTLSLHAKRTTTLSALQESLRVLPSLLALKVSFLLFLLIGTTFLCLPGLIAASADTALSRTLFIFGFAILLPVIVIAAFTETYASLYIILSKTSFTSSMRLGYALFRRRSSTSIVFTAISFLTVILVSAFSQLWMSVAGSFYPVASHREYVISFVLFGIQMLFFVVRTAAWLSLFAFIHSDPVGTPTEEASQKSEKMIQKEVPEIG
jgi:hypothetical protein